MNHSPKIAAIICTYNREKYIYQALQSVYDSDLPKHDWELVVVNNNSTDQSEKEIFRFREAHPDCNFKYVIETNQGLSYSRNRGVLESTASYLTFLDDDAIATKDFLSKSVSYLESNKNLIAIGGKIIPNFVDGKPSWYTKYYWGVTGQFDLGDEAFKILYKGKFPCGSNMTFVKDFFQEYGFFNPNLGRKGVILLAGEEKELFSRVPANKKDFVMYYPDLIVYHCVDNSKLNTTYLEKFCYGFANGEKLEVQHLPFLKKSKRYIEFTIKSKGAMALGTMYFFSGKFEKGKILYLFGWWILKGFWFKKFQTS